MPSVPISGNIVGFVSGQVDSTTPQVSSTRQGADSIHLAHPTTTRNPDSLPNSPKTTTFSLFPTGAGGSNKNTSNQRPFLLLDTTLSHSHPINPQQSNANEHHSSKNTTSNNEAYTIVCVDPSPQTNSNPNSSSSSSDDDDEENGGDEESDSTGSVSTDESDDNRHNINETQSVRHNINHQLISVEKKIQKQQNQSIMSCPPHYEKKEDTDKMYILQSNEFYQKSNEQNVLLTHEWPVGRPLPLPRWDENKPPGVVHFENVLSFEEFAGFVELVSQRTVADHKYNTVGNFIRFYRAFKKSKIESLELFYRQYQSPLTPCHYTCVGLAYELIHQINSTLPTDHPAMNKLYITSCEEAIETTDEYVKNTPPDREIVEKEHVSICLKIQIGSNRSGCLLLDPGYHVSRPIVIMEDQNYPHTGKFVQCDDGTNKKEYHYTFVTPEYINWDVIDTKKGKVNCYSNLIFVARAFLSGLDCAERRNLVYDFKSILKRDHKGQVTAGLYFPLQTKNTNPKTMTIFFMENNNRTNIRLNISRNVKSTREIQMCEEQMGLSRGKLTQMMNTIGKIVHDDSFLDQTLRLNAEIVRISAEN